MKNQNVLVQMHAAGVNLLDAKIKDGEFKLVLPSKLPLILGNDVAGIVLKVGSRVSRFKVGDEVYARPEKDRIGTFAERIAMNENDVALKPARLSAAGRPDHLASPGRTGPGQERRQGVHPGRVGRRGDHRDSARQAPGRGGGDHRQQAELQDVESPRCRCIDYKTEDFEQKLSSYNQVLHSQGSKELEKSLRVLKSGGKLIPSSGASSA